MDFFARQDQARRKTKWLIIYFVLAVISIIVMIYGVALLGGFYAVSRHHYYGGPPQLALWNPQLFTWVSLGTIAVIFLGSAYKTMALSEGGSAVAESLGGRPVASNTNDPNERKLLNVVEEMSIASGVPMPKVYVLEEEDGINAFAAGHTPSDAVVAVTRNCMTRLTRDELQGVIGHEFSHILNGDMRLNIRLIGILFGIFCIATIGRILMQMRSGSSRDRNPLPLAGLLLLAIGSLGVFFGRLIQAAVSRQREFLADASSVQFTRNPAGLSGALQKIGGFGSAMESPHAADASHLFFASGFASSFFGMMATHPPLEERIRAIDPAWDGKFRRVSEEAPRSRYDARAPQPSRPAAAPFPDLLGTVIGGAVLGSENQRAAVIKPHAVLPNLGNPTPLHLKYAEALRNALPDSVKSAVREPLDASAVMYALLLSQDDSLRARQVDELAGRVSRAVADQVTALYPDVAKTAAHARLPLVNLALPALRQLDASQFSQFSKTLEWLIDSDGQVELFEFVVQKILRRHLDSHFNGARRQVAQYYTLKPLVPDCAVILSALANVGSEDPVAVGKAFDAGVPFLHAPQGSDLALLPVAQCGIEQLDAALNRLALAVPIIKKSVLQASANVVGADGVIQESEAELLRAIADTLDCPIPPLGVTE
ncbi:MAG TPA: M48 family metallopeptidase [Candidatus Acidoferrales bacterium]|nr:M48 family metallopeptidase [Candidatus Acidoferrales bacterium]